MSNVSSLRLVVLDCDGTMVDSLQSLVDCLDVAFTAHGLTPPQRSLVRNGIGLELFEAVERLAPELSKPDLERLTNTYRDVALAKQDNGDWDDPLYAGARDAIQLMDRENWLLGIATGKSYRGVEKLLQRHDLKDYFITRQTSDRAAGKPNPEMLFNAMRDAGVDKASTVMVGDTSFDMQMAVNAGVSAIGVSWGYHSNDDLNRAGADIIIDHYSQLFGAVEKLLGPIR